MSKGKDILLCCFYIIAVCLVLIVIVLEIYTFIIYGAKPIDEIPSWVCWLWFGGGSR